MRLLLSNLLLLVLAAASVAAAAKKPWVIAHRGSSGDYPELTMQAFEAAADEGTDMLELDTAVTADHQVIVLHEPNLSPTTNVANHFEFLDRQRVDTIYSDDDHNETVTDWFTWNFTLSEVLQLRKNQRMNFRDASFNGKQAVPTLRQLVQLVKQRDSGRQPHQRKVALLIEVKLCLYYTARTGRRKEELVAAVLEEEGVVHRPDLIHLQTFELECAAELKRRMPSLPVYKLEQSSGISDERMASWHRDFKLDGIGVHKAMVAGGSDPGAPGFSNKYRVNGSTGLVERAHRLPQFKVLVWTLRNEDRYIPWSFNQDATAEAAFHIDVGADGLITDFPKTIRRLVDACRGAEKASSSGFLLTWLTALAALIQRFGVA